MIKIKRGNNKQVLLENEYGVMSAAYFKKVNYEELDTLLKHGRSQLNCIFLYDLSLIQFKGYLIYQFFTMCNLQNANMDELIIREAKFFECLMQGISLVNSDLRGASFAGSNLMGANLKGSNLSNVDFRGVNLSNVLFDRHTNFSNVSTDENTVMDDDLRQFIVAQNM